MADHENQPPVNVNAVEDIENANVEGDNNANADGDDNANDHVGADAGADNQDLLREILAQNRLLMERDRLLIDRLIQPAAQRGATLENLSVSTPEKWMSFRQHFLAVLDTKNWTVQQAKRELKAAFRDEAANCITGIDFHINNAEVTVIDILNLLEARFLAGRGTSRAIEDFRSATQNGSETIQGFYGRLWSLYKRAYPDADGNADINLINQFNQGLKDSQVRIHQCMARHDTLDQALQRACVAEAGVIQAQRLAGGRLNNIGDQATSPGPQIAAFGQYRPAQRNQYQPAPRLTPLTPGACLVCNKSDHRWRECPTHLAFQRSIHLTRGGHRGGSRSRFGGRGSSRGNRGRQGPRGGGRGRNFTPRPSGVHALAGERSGPSDDSNNLSAENPLADEDADMGTEEVEEEDDLGDYAEYYEDGPGFGSGLE